MAGATLIIFSYTAVEYFLYAESGVMCLSILLTIMSAKIFTEHKKYSKIKAALILICALYCYQGSVNLFIPLVLMLLYIDKEYSSKDQLKQMVMALAVYGGCCIVNILTINIFNNLLGNTQDRVTAIQNLHLINFERIKKISVYLYNRVFKYNFNLTPQYSILIFMAICSISIMCQKRNQIGKYIALMLACIMASIIPIFIMKKPGVDPRTIMSIGSTVGLSIIFLNSFLDYQSQVIKYFIISITSVLLIYNFFNTVYLFNAHIYTNKIDREIGELVKQRIDNYENETGRMITKYAYCSDLHTIDHPREFDKKLSSFNQRAFDNKYILKEVIYYYCNRRLEEVKMDKEIYNDYFKNKNWSYYSDEQIVFKDDTMYICRY